MSWTQPTRNTDTYIQSSRNTGSNILFARHGTDPRIKDFADFTFNDIVFPDGTVLKDVTFAEVADATWTYINRN